MAELEAADDRAGYATWAAIILGIALPGPPRDDAALHYRSGKKIAANCPTPFALPRTPPARSARPRAARLSRIGTSAGSHEVCTPARSRHFHRGWS